MSGVVRSSFGLHLIRRPPLAEVRDSFREVVHVDRVEARRAPLVRRPGRDRARPGAGPSDPRGHRFDAAPAAGPASRARSAADSGGHAPQARRGAPVTWGPGLCSVALLLLGTVPGVIRAQGGARSQIVDRIVAVVGTTPITASQVEEQLALMQSEGQQLPSDSAGRTALRRQILTQMVEEELLVQQAQRDTNIKVTDREGQDQVEQTVQNGRKQVTSWGEVQSQLRAAGFGSAGGGRGWGRGKPSP